MSRYRKGRRRAALLGITVGCVGAAVFLGVSVKLYRERKDAEAMIESRHAAWEQNTAGESSDPPEAGPDPEKMLSEAAVSWNGKEYRRNTYMKAVLCMGVDRENTMTGGEEPGQRGQADGIFLAAWDTARNGLKILMIPRDAMTYLSPVSWDGTVRDEEYDHITLAFSYGDGYVKSCENMVREVEEMFKGLHVDHYMATDLSAVGILNEAVGGVTVTIPAGLSAADPRFQEGSRITLKGDQAEEFVRYRDTKEDHSALYRTLRSQEFITGFFDAAQKMAETDSQTVPRLFELTEEYMITDMAKDQYMGMAADILASEDLTSDHFYVLPGRAVVTETYDEYHVDEDAMTELLLEFFYREA